MKVKIKIDMNKFRNKKLINNIMKVKLMKVKLMKFLKKLKKDFLIIKYTVYTIESKKQRKQIILKE